MPMLMRGALPLTEGDAARSKLTVKIALQNILDRTFQTPIKSDGEFLQTFSGALPEPAAKKDGDFLFRQKIDQGAMPDAAQITVFLFADLPVFYFIKRDRRRSSKMREDMALLFRYRNDHDHSP